MRALRDPLARFDTRLLPQRLGFLASRPDMGHTPALVQQLQPLIIAFV
jgi:hypothetical protein